MSVPPAPAQTVTTASTAPQRRLVNAIKDRVARPKSAPIVTPTRPEGWRPPNSPSWLAVPEKLWDHVYVVLNGQPRSPVLRRSVSVLRRWKRLDVEAKQRKKTKSRRKTAEKSRRQQRGR